MTINHHTGELDDPIAATKLRLESFNSILKDAFSDQTKNEPKQTVVSISTGRFFKINKNSSHDIEIITPVKPNHASHRIAIYNFEYFCSSIIQSYAYDPKNSEIIDRFTLNNTKLIEFDIGSHTNNNHHPGFFLITNHSILDLVKITKDDDLVAQWEKIFLLPNINTTSSTKVNSL